MNPETTNRKPANDKQGNLFIVGCPRSGTTAVVHLLNSHPRLAVGMERFKYSAEKGLLGPDLFEAEQFFDFSPDQTNLLPKSKIWADFYNALRPKFATARWIGDKNPGYFRRFDALESKFENPIWLVMMRDVLEVAASYEQRAITQSDPWPLLNDYTKAVIHWNDFLVQVKQMLIKAPGRVRLCQYELLFSGDTSYLDSLLQFFDVSGDSQMDAYFAELCKDWPERQQRRKRLWPEAEAYVEKHANRELFDEILNWPG